MSGKKYLKKLDEVSIGDGVLRESLLGGRHMAATHDLHQHIQDLEARVTVCRKLINDLAWDMLGGKNGAT